MEICTGLRDQGDQKWVLDDAGALLASLAGAGVEFPVEADTLEPGAGRAGTAQILGLVDRAHESGPRKATSSVAGLLEHEKDNMVDYGRGDSPVGWRWVRWIAKRALGEIKRRNHPSRLERVSQATSR